MTATGVDKKGFTNIVTQPLQRGNSPFRNFTVAWAIASLFHMAHSGIFDTRLNLALLSIAALYVIFRPTLPGLIALILLQLMDVAFRMPDVTNHWIFTAFVNLTILQSVLYCVYKRKSFAVDEMDVFDTFAPAVRIEVLILYFFAVFHKLNSGFFSPEVSCATELLRAQHMGGILSTFPQLLSLNAYFTIAIELGILVMLCFRRTRHAGVFIGFLFHLVLSYSTYNAFFDFTSMILAVYFLFTSYDFNARVDEWKKNAGSKTKALFGIYSTARLIIVCGVIIFVVGILAGLNKILHDPAQFHLYFFWTLYGLVLTYLLAKFLFVKVEQSGIEKPFALRSSWLLILPVIVFLNGTSPYLGLKTENSYAMFSNLRTEGGVSNHFILPAEVQIFGYQKEMVEIVSSSDSKLQRLAEANQLMVLFEFRDHLQQHRPAEVVYRLNGQEKIFRKGETPMTGELSPNSVLLSRLMKFRTISKAEPQPCAH